MSPVSPLSFEVHRPELSILFRMLIHLYLVRIGGVLSHYCLVSWGCPFWLFLAGRDLDGSCNQVNALTQLSVQLKPKLLYTGEKNHAQTNLYLPLEVALRGYSMGSNRSKRKSFSSKVCYRVYLGGPVCAGFDEIQYLFSVKFICV